MIIDLRELNELDAVQSDICVIGGGASGIAIANEFNNSKFNTVVLESGSLNYDSKIQELYDGELTYSGFGFKKNSSGVLTNDRLRYFGGTTGHWGGMVAPFDDIDFKQRTWVPNSGWPFNRNDLIPYYNRASKLLGIPKYNFDSLSNYNSFRNFTNSSEETINTKLFFDASTGKKLRFGDIFLKQFKDSKNIRLFLNATVTNLKVNHEGRFVESLIVNKNNPNEKKITIKSKVYILSCGAIENARILLLSDSVFKNGLCNDNDLVGRFFQQHGYTPNINNHIHMLINNKKIFDLYGVHKFKNTNAWGFLTLSPKLQEKNKLLNSYFSINNWSPIIEDDKITRSMKRNYIKFLNNLGINSPNKWYSVKSVMLHEQEPNFYNRVSLSDDRDWLNQRKVKITSQISDLQIQTMISTFRVFGNFLGQNFLGKVRIESDIKELFESPGTQGHHIGTTRMSASSSNGVVDQNCKTHSIDNLYIGGSSTFPTGSATNPTFTILAMSIRLADHLKQYVL
jgi:choline dehydrogenase-like flavoprotein